MIPPGCTGYVQPLDVAVNKPLKDMIQEEAELHYDAHMDEWARGKFSVGDRRIMLTQWVGKAWIKFHEQHRGTIVRSFRKIGVTLAIDGSEDEELAIKDIPDVEVGDWRLEHDIQETPLLGENGLVAPHTDAAQYVIATNQDANMMEALDGEDDEEGGEEEDMEDIDRHNSSEDVEYDLDPEYEQDESTTINNAASIYVRRAST